MSNHKGGGHKYPVQNAVSRDKVVKLTHMDGGVIYVRQFDVAAALAGANGQQHVFTGGNWFPVKDTIPEIFRKLGWEQTL